jgi:hypothetical protein
VPIRTVNRQNLWLSSMLIRLSYTSAGYTHPLDTIFNPPFPKKRHSKDRQEPQATARSRGQYTHDTFSPVALLICTYNPSNALSIYIQNYTKKRHSQS